VQLRSRLFVLPAMLSLAAGACDRAQAGSVQIRHESPAAEFEAPENSFHIDSDDLYPGLPFVVFQSTIHLVRNWERNPCFRG